VSLSPLRSTLTACGNAVAYCSMKRAAFARASGSLSWA